MWNYSKASIQQSDRLFFQGNGLGAITDREGYFAFLSQSADAALDVFSSSGSSRTNFAIVVELFLSRYFQMLPAVRPTRSGRLSPGATAMGLRLAFWVRLEGDWGEAGLTAATGCSGVFGRSMTATGGSVVA
ncbi:MAG: hypothetical protein ACXWTY_12535 [Methylobacter sp.]